MIAGNGDTSHGPILTIDGKKVQTYLIQLIDDASRLIVGYEFFLNDNSKYHTGINDIPRNRFQRDYEKLKFIDTHEEVDKIFLHVEEKPVALDATIRLGKKDYEVPQKYIKQRIIVKYSPEDLSFVYIYNEKTKELEKVYPIDKIANSKIKRKTISYS